MPDVEDALSEHGDDRREVQHEHDGEAREEHLLGVMAVLGALHPFDHAEDVEHEGRDVEPEPQPEGEEQVLFGFAQNKTGSRGRTNSKKYTALLIILKLATPQIKMFSYPKMTNDYASQIPSL